jgi:hypothetical protein
MCSTFAVVISHWGVEVTIEKTVYWLQLGFTPLPPIYIFPRYDETIVFIVLHPSSCHVHAKIDIECLYLSLYHCNALVYICRNAFLMH